MSCTGQQPAPRTPEPNADLTPGLRVTVNLRYERPATFTSAGRPEAIHVIADYHSDRADQRYPGSWDEATQTLSATVLVPMRVENLVYVDDPAIQPGATTTIRAGRGALKEVTCPQNVNPLFTCDILQVLH